MTDDLISRQAAIDALNGEIEITGRTNAEAVKGYVRLVKDRLERLPSAQRAGKWLDDGQYDNFFPHHEWRCSECGEHVIEIDTPWYKYCPNCGALMDGEVEGKSK